MLVLGFDPGSIVTGYGLVLKVGAKLTCIDYGCIRPPKSENFSERMKALFLGAEELIDKHKPDIIAIETQYVHRNVQSALKLAMARNSLVLPAALKGIEVCELNPVTAKMAVLGKGQATKEQVQYMVAKLLQLAAVPTPADAADALALAIACHNRNQKLAYV